MQVGTCVAFVVAAGLRGGLPGETVEDFAMDGVGRVEPAGLPGDLRIAGSADQDHAFVPQSQRCLVLDAVHERRTPRVRDELGFAGHLAQGSVMAVTRNPRRGAWGGWCIDPAG